MGFFGDLFNPKPAAAQVAPPKLTAPAYRGPKIPHSGETVKILVKGTQYKTGTKHRQAILALMKERSGKYHDVTMSLDVCYFEESPYIGVFANGFQIGAFPKEYNPWALERLPRLTAVGFDVYGGEERRYGAHVHVRLD